MGRIEDTRTIKALATQHGFDGCGISGAAPIAHGDYFRTWLKSGRAGTMAYLGRDPERRVEPAQLLPGAKSVIVVAISYRQDQSPPPEGTGRVAMYAWGEDYHVVLKDRLFAFVDALREHLGVAFDAKVCVDTAPIVEREVAARAGVGWIGKNTLVLHPQLGSYFFLGEVITTLDLEENAPMEDHCGTCTACLDACPTNAFPAPYEMDASKCISYLTIEHRDKIDPALARQMDDWVFGCDVCQQVCPHNAEAEPTSEARFAPREPWPTVPISTLLSWTDEEYRRHLRGSAMKRAKPEMLRRNAAIAARNTGSFR